MVEQHAHATRYIRAFGLFTLLAGIVAMHIAVFGMPHSGADRAMSAGNASPAAGHRDHAAMAAASHVSAASAPARGHHPAALSLAAGHQPTALTAPSPERGIAAPACGDCGDGHPGLHGCVFILAALLLGLGLALLGWAGLRRDPPATAQARRLRAHRARPPPWTHLSLAELAILRI
ncbi:hypothetical protein JK358_16250 [Nocardia sp. 2]|uniref:DUF2946 domain-containing protein n=1 Tax=Nocardia acididurans TaxID=2802282 RepID=A0ABS1M5S6_9NOCA|nr:hypothetical protein [Nocardia acididurans]MBL1075950.1 hypothetical protein [Nocardia acididurans]